MTSTFHSYCASFVISHERGSLLFRFMTAPVLAALERALKSQLGHEPTLDKLLVSEGEVMLRSKHLYLGIRLKMAAAGELYTGSMSPIRRIYEV